MSSPVAAFSQSKKILDENVFLFNNKGVNTIILAIIKLMMDFSV